MLGGNFKVANNDDNPFVYVDWSPNLGIRVQELPWWRKNAYQQYNFHLLIPSLGSLISF